MSKINFNGNIIWRTNYSIGNHEFFRDFDVLPDGSSLVTSVWDAPQYDFFLTRIDNNCNLLYENQFYANGHQFVRDLEINNDGAIWISGFERPFNIINYNAFILKVDTDGNVITKDTIPNPFPGDNRSIMTDFTITPDKNILCYWKTADNGNYLMKLDTNYNVLWQTQDNV